MAIPQNATYAGLPLIGADVLVPRGTRPGVARLRLCHDMPLNLSSGVLSVQAGSTIQFAGMVPDLATLRWEHRPHGKREYRLNLYDRRHNWPEKLVSGRYNVRRRDNSIESGEKDVNLIAYAALLAAEELSAVPGAMLTHKPQCLWDQIPVTEALEQLSRILPLHVCRKANDTFTVQLTGEGNELPASSGIIIPDFMIRTDSGPEEVHARLGPTWFMCGLELECVGLELDGQYLTLDELSYEPGGGWYEEWPDYFAGVDQDSRGHAFESVYRVYRVKVPQTLPFDAYELTDLENLILDDHGLVFGQMYQPQAQVVGTYWPYSDHYENVDNCPLQSGSFVLDKQLRAIKLEYPLWKKDGNNVVPADLRLYTAFHLRDAETGELLRDEYDVSRTAGTGRQTVDLPFLWRARAMPPDDCEYSEEEDNQESLETEVMTYLDAWKGHWDAVRDKRFVPYAGVEAVDTSGNVAEVRYRIGRGLTPKTEASQHYRNSLVKL
jgi:hypothetical protein